MYTHTITYLFELSYWPMLSAVFAIYYLLYAVCYMLYTMY